MSSEFLIEDRITIISNIAQSNNLIFNGFVGNVYKNQHTLLKLVCTKHGEWSSTSFKSFVKLGTRCPYCSGVGKYTKEIAENQILSKLNSTKSTLKFLGFNNWSNKNTKMNKCIFLCEKGHTWNTCTITDFVNKLNSNCGICSGGVKLNPKDEENEIKRILLEQNSKITFKKFETWQGCNTKIVFMCNEHGEWNSTSINSFKSQLVNCPRCCVYGYNKNKSGYFYIQKLTNEDKIYYKFGITNNDVVIRMNQQKMHSIFSHEIILSLYFENGEIPFLIEREIKKYITCGVISKNELGNGFTETIESKHINDVLDLIKKFKD